MSCASGADCDSDSGVCARPGLRACLMCPGLSLSVALSLFLSLLYASAQELSLCKTTSALSVIDKTQQQHRGHRQGDSGFEQEKVVAVIV